MALMVEDRTAVDQLRHELDELIIGKTPDRGKDNTEDVGPATAVHPPVRNDYQAADIAHWAFWWVKAEGSGATWALPAFLDLQTVEALFAKYFGDRANPAP